MTCGPIVFLVVIAPRKQKEKLVSELHEHQANYMNVMYGHGSLKGSPLASVFGFESEAKKVVITAFVRKEKSSEVIILLEEKFKFNQANTGFAFTIPIEMISH